jgi:hypothetical protein
VIVHQIDINNEMKLISEALADEQQGPPMGDFLSAKIHEAFTLTADKMAQIGLVTQDERIALSSAIGDALDAFKQSCEEKCGEATTKVLSREMAMTLM